MSINTDDFQKQKEMLNKLNEMKEKDYDYINPSHYVADDGRQTWERMVDKWGLEATALWCEMTAFKYTDTRMGKKPNEDTEREQKKVKWYLEKAKELRKRIIQEALDKNPNQLW
jgi:hypothetical protein